MNTKTLLPIATLFTLILSAPALANSTECRAIDAMQGTYHLVETEDPNDGCAEIIRIESTENCTRDVRTSVQGANRLGSSWPIVSQSNEGRRIRTRTAAGFEDGLPYIEFRVRVAGRPAEPNYSTTRNRFLRIRETDRLSLARNENGETQLVHRSTDRFRALRSSGCYHDEWFVRDSSAQECHYRIETSN